MGKFLTLEMQGQEQTSTPAAISDLKPEARASLATGSQWMARHRHNRTGGEEESSNLHRRASTPTQILAVSGPSLGRVTCVQRADCGRELREGRSGWDSRGDRTRDEGIHTSQHFRLFRSALAVLSRPPVSHVWRDVCLHAKPCPLIFQPLRSPVAGRQEDNPARMSKIVVVQPCPSRRWKCCELLIPSAFGQTPLRQRC